MHFIAQNRAIQKLDYLSRREHVAALVFQCVLLIENKFQGFILATDFKRRKKVYESIGWRSKSNQQ